MWGLVRGCTSSTGSFAGSVDSLERRGKVVHHGVELGPQRRWPPHQHVIVAGAKRFGGSNANQFAQAPPHAVAFHGIADLLGDRESHTGWSGLGAPARLQDEGACRRACASCGILGGGPKVTPAFQPLHKTDIRTVLNRNRDSGSSSGAFGSSTQFLTATRPARGQNPAPALGGHAGAEAMAALAYQFARLIGPFHGESPLRDIPAALRLASGPKPPRLARLISEGSPPVNVTSQPFAGILYAIGDAVHP